jgi:putative PIN family toxin of toxin-antitoxin system
MDALNVSVDSIITGILELSKLYEDNIAHPIVHKDPDDDKFIFCAMVSKAKYVISGDRHLLDLQQYNDVKIVSPASLFSDVRIFSAG